MTAGLWMPPVVVAGASLFLLGMTLLDRLVVSPVLLAAQPPAEPLGLGAPAAPTGSGQSG
jgi:hypothetical protein